jgi:methionyl aminopeptidase
MIKVKTDTEIKSMRQGGRILAKILNELIKNSSVGVSTLELNSLSEQLCEEHGVIPSFKGYEGYQHSLVTCINEEIVHGIPGKRTLSEGDLLTLDFGIKFQGFHTDMAKTIVVGKSNQRKDKLLQIGQSALQNAISQARIGNRIGAISQAMQTTVEKNGFNVVRIFVGHGIGKNLHEDPEIPCYGYPDEGELIKDGMTFAIEVMYMEGSFQVKILPDGWTAVTKDGSLSAMFEHTVLVLGDGPQILTQA